MIVVATLRPFGLFAGTSISDTTLISLLVALIPTTIGALLSAIGIAGMDRLVRRNVLALSGRAVEASGDVDVLLLDKTGTITIGNRLASEFIPMPGVPEAELAEVAQLSSLADETPEGRSIVVLAKQYGIREHDMNALHAAFVPFSAQTRMSGVNLNGNQLRKGAGDAIINFVVAEGGRPPAELQPALDRIGREGGTPLAVARDSTVMGVIYLKDTIKEGMRERFDHLRQMGIRTVMITGDNRLTAAKIAEESGVDDFLAEATPEAKLALIKEQQSQGRMVAMTGDGTNDAPALAQADVGVAMNTGTQAAREAGNMVDLDSNPTKLIEIVEVGKQLLITRGALTTFSIANDVAKYFAILPAIFLTTYAATTGGQGPLHVLNIMNLGSPRSAVISAIIFNALVIPLLDPHLAQGGGLPADRRQRTVAPQPVDLRARRADRPVHRHQADRPRRPQHPGRLMQAVALGARLHRRSLDRDLACGIAAWRSPAHAARVAQLTERHATAAAWPTRSTTCCGRRSAPASHAGVRARSRPAGRSIGHRQSDSAAGGAVAFRCPGGRGRCPPPPGAPRRRRRADLRAGGGSMRWTMRSRWPSAGSTSRNDPMAVSRGRHKVFLGMAAGVGKTYRMLQEGQAEAMTGRDVVIGYLEPHGRLETLEQAAGLEVVPRRRVEYRDTAAGGDGPAGSPAPRSRALPHRRTGPHQRPGHRAPQALRGRRRTCWPSGSTCTPRSTSSIWRASTTRSPS